MKFFNVSLVSYSAMLYNFAMLPKRDRDIQTDASLSKDDQEILQSHIEALIVTMHRMGVNKATLIAENESKSGGQVQLIPFVKE